MAGSRGDGEGPRTPRVPSQRREITPGTASQCRHVQKSRDTAPNRSSHGRYFSAKSSSLGSQTESAILSFIPRVLSGHAHGSPGVTPFTGQMCSRTLGTHHPLWQEADPSTCRSRPHCPLSSGVKLFQVGHRGHDRRRALCRTQALGPDPGLMHRCLGP